MASERRRVLVTGASGFAGEHLARAFAWAGYRVFAQGFERAPSLERVPGGEALRGDLSDADEAARLVAHARPDAVVHCAAWTDVLRCERDPEGAERAIVTATEQLARALRGSRARLVALSTDLVFDGREGGYDERATPRPVSAYGRAKLRAERVVLEGAGALVLRAALLYGPPATHKGSFLAWMTRALRQGEALELFTDERRSPLWSEDLCAACVALCDAASGPLEGVLHAGGAEGLSRYAMGEQLARVLGVEAPRLVARTLAEAPWGAPRPADVTLRSEALWRRVGRTPASFELGVRAALAMSA